MIECESCTQIFRILNGGPGPSFLLPAIVDFIFGGIPMIKPQVEDVLIGEKTIHLIERSQLRPVQFTRRKLLA